MDMPEEASAIDVYYDMDIAQICQHFNKSRNTVDKAIAKLVKDNPELQHFCDDCRKQKALL